MPQARDLVRPGTTVKEEAYFEDDDDEWFEEYAVDDMTGDQEWWQDDEAFFEYDDEDDVPEELEEAMDQADEAYVSYVESRKRMKELALSRGFYPVVALSPDFERNSFKGSKGEGGSKGSGKGKGKSGKGKGKSKGKGSGGFMRRPFNRRPMSGLRKPSASAITNNINDKSTLSGSTAQHGPRFKRYRSQVQGIKEVPEEITMVED